MRNTKSMPWEKAPKEFSKQLQIAKQIEGLDVHDKIPCLSYHILRCVLMRRKIFTRQCFAFLHRQVRGGLSLFIYILPTLPDFISCSYNFPSAQKLCSLQFNGMIL